MSPPDFGAAHAVLQRHVDQRLLPGVCAAVQRHGQPLDGFCSGWADVESRTPLRPDHIHRAFSNTKLVTSVLALRLADEGRWSLDDPVKAWIPAFGRLRVMRPAAAGGVQVPDDTEPLQHDMTIRHLLTHQAGFSHGVFDPATPIYDAYHAAGIRRPDTTLAQLMDLLAELPLLFQPGCGWQYSLATDVLARLCEIACGEPFGDALQRRVLGPLGMVDTGFVLRPDQRPRWTTLYAGDPAEPMRPGLRRLDDTPWPGAWQQPVPRQSGAGGLFTTLADMLALLDALRPGGTPLLEPATRAQLFTDQLPAGRSVAFPDTGAIPGLGFGLAGAITRAASALAPEAAVGTLQWGGLAGTHWSIHPSSGLAVVLMTQRFMGFWHPFWFDYQRRVHAAAG